MAVRRFRYSLFPLSGLPPSSRTFAAHHGRKALSTQFIAISVPVIEYRMTKKKCSALFLNAALMCYDRIRH
jgi:hypothetical protein